MSSSVEVASRISAESLLADARAQLERVTYAEALEEQSAGARLIDIRSSEHRARDGEIPGAIVIERNVLEWRLDPASPHRDEQLARPGARMILVCDEGFQSSLAAATLRLFGLDATDVIGGFRGWS
jgi:rhodanese-related sulfurtransferase